MAALLTCTRMLITITILIFVPTVISQTLCGDTSLHATETVQYFYSPGYPYSYSNNMYCQWLIASTLPSKGVALILLDFNLEYQSSCSYDYVTLYDGRYTLSTKMQTLCGQYQNVTFTSSGTYMTVVFHSDASNIYKGFKFAYMVSNGSGLCGDSNLLADRTVKYITSPGYPINYPKDMIFDYEDDVRISISDCNSTNVSPIQNLCGHVPNTTFTSTGTSMIVEFHSDSTDAYRGFKFEYTVQDRPADCRDIILWANETTNYLTSPNYPNNYLNNMNCSWHIRTNSYSKVIVLELMNFSLEYSQPYCSSDYVSIYDGISTSSPKILQLCGSYPNTTFTSTGTSMTVAFHSGYSNSNKGFKFGYKIKEKPADCSGIILQADGTAKYLTSQNYPSNYPSNSNCRWKITSSIPSDVIILKLLDFHVDDTSLFCSSDSVYIYDGDNTYSPSIQTLCGSVQNTTFISSGSSMVVTFHSDAYSNSRGFKFEYNSLEKSALCGATTLWANGTVNYIISPGYPNYYPNNMICQWLITSTSSSKVVALNLLDFSLEDSSSCSFDYVALYDGNSTRSPRIQIFCGQVSATTFTSTGSSMTVVFHSNSGNSNDGFKFGYIDQNKPAQCADAHVWANENVKYITSPDYPNIYRNNTGCQWHIRASLSSNVVVLKLLDFNLVGYSRLCQDANVTIYDGITSMSDVLQILCGQVSNTTYISSSNFMTVVLYPGYSYNYKVFKFEFTSIKKSDLCGQTNLRANETAQYITSPAYPNSYPNGMNCQWSISTSSSNVIVLKMLDLNVEKYLSYCNDYVSIYDGISTGNSRLMQWCGQVQNVTILSSSTNITVVFQSGYSGNDRGFNLEYTSMEKSALCGGSILWANEIAENITSPGYPYNYPVNIDCQWHIKASSSSKVVKLKLFDFYIKGSSPYCNYDSVSIYDGDSINSPRMQLLCDQVLYQEFTSTGSSLTVVLKSYSVDSYSYSYNSRNKGFSLGYMSSSVRTAPCTSVTLKADVILNYLYSPNYPYRYPSNTDCQWHINSGSDSKVVSLTISNFVLDGSVCGNDYVKILDGPSVSSSQIASLCGTEYSRTIDSTGSDMTIVFHSDSSVNGNGFRLSYVSKKNDFHIDSDVDLSTGGIVAVIFSVSFVVVFFTVIAIYIKRAQPKTQIRNTQNRIAGQTNRRQVSGRENGLYFVSQPNINTAVVPNPYAGAVNSYNIYSPPPYASLNFDVIAPNPSIASSGPGNNVNNLPPPPPYSNGLAFGTSQQIGEANVNQMACQNVPPTGNLPSSNSPAST